MSVLIRLLLIAAAMSAVLIGMIASHAYRRESGTEIVLAMQPVDPRDLLAGYYVVISTDLHLLETAELGGDAAGFRRGGDIFVTVREGEDGVWRPASIHLQRPDSGVYLRGKVSHVMERWRRRAAEGENDDERPSAQTIGARFNLERYYADAATAQALEAMMMDALWDDDSRLRLIVSVPADGGAVIRGLIIDGERRYDRLF